MRVRGPSIEYDMMPRNLFLVLMALLLAAGCADRKEPMLAQLAELERQNVADSLMTNDSLAKALVAYFDDHGTRNERLRAHYILGRTYADLGEAPAALDAYLDAAACADTTAADCDWGKLSRVYGQMADVYYNQNLLEDYIKFCDYSIDCAWKANDTLQALNTSALKIVGYDILLQFDAVISAFDSIYPKLKQYGGEEWASRYAVLPVRAMLNNGDLRSSGICIKTYEEKSGYFDASHEIALGMEDFYYLKGLYLLQLHQADSAKYYFRKELDAQLGFENQSMAARGLSLAYMQLHQPDSAAKYGIYSYEMNDSAYAEKSTKEVELIAAQHNYSRNRLLAEQKSHEARQTKIMLMLVVSLAAVVTLLFVLSFWAYRKRQQQRHLQYRHDMAKLERAQVELMQLRTEENLALSSIIQQKDVELEEWKRSVAEHQAKASQADSSQLEGKLQNASIVLHLKDLVQQNPTRQASNSEMKELWNLMNELVPSFYDELKSLRLVEYHVCLLLRAHFGPAEICKLTGLRDDYLPHLRKRLLQKVYGVEGTAKDFDVRIMAIV